MEVKEYIITAESSKDLITEAAKSLWTNGLDSTSMFCAIAPMSLDDDKITRVITMNGVTVTVTEDAYIAFADAYFTEKANSDIAAWNAMAQNKQEAEIQMAEMWQEAGYEWPYEIKDYSVNTNTI